MSTVDERSGAVTTGRVGSWVLLLLTLAITLGFYEIVQPFVLAVLFAAIIAGVSHPLHARLLRSTNGRASLAVLLALVVVFVVIVPLLLFLVVLTGQAIQVIQSVGPWIDAQLQDTGGLERELVGGSGRCP